MLGTMIEELHEKHGRLEASLAAALCRIEALEKQQGEIMELVTVDKSQIDAVQTGVATLKADTSSALGDIAAKLSSLQSATPDSATATELGGILSDVQTLDANVKGADPGPIAPVTPAPTA